MTEKQMRGTERFVIRSFKLFQSKPEYREYFEDSAKLHRILKRTVIIGENSEILAYAEECFAKLRGDKQNEKLH